MDVRTRDGLRFIRSLYEPANFALKYPRAGYRQPHPRRRRRYRSFTLAKINSRQLRGNWAIWMPRYQSARSDNNASDPRRESEAFIPACYLTF